MSRGFRWVSVFFLVVVGSNPVTCLAQATVPDRVEQRGDEFLKQASNYRLSGAFTENYQPYSGVLNINMVDIRLPGKNGLDLVIQRYYSSSIWNRTDQHPQHDFIYHTAGIDAGDNLGGNGWQFHMGKIFNPLGEGSPPDTPRNNPVIVMPDGSEHVLYSSDNPEDPHEMKTAERWICTWDGEAESYFLTTNNGTIYEFHRSHYCPLPSCRGGTCANCGTGICECEDEFINYRDMFGGLVYQATAIEDIHGNRIEIHYDGEDTQWGVIQEIVDTYGRIIEFRYLDLEVEEATSDDPKTIRRPRLEEILVRSPDRTILQTWRYKYKWNPFYEPWEETYSINPGAGLTYSRNRKIDLLVEVIPPEGDAEGTNPNYSWKFDYYPTSIAEADGMLMLKSVDFPSGGRIEYAYSGTNYNVGHEDSTVQFATLAQKTVSGRGVTPGTWTYYYDFAGEEGHITTITGPNNFSETYEYHGWGEYVYEDPDMWKVGLLKEQITSYGSQIVRINNTWRQGKQLSVDYRATTPWNGFYGSNAGRISEGIFFVKPETMVKTITRQGFDYTTTQSLFDDYGNPQRIVELGDVARTTYLDYWYNTDRHLLSGLVQYKNQVPGGREQIWYNDFGRVEKRMVNASARDALDGLETRYEYHPSGDLHQKIVENGDVDSITSYTDYQFGLPQKTTIANFDHDIEILRQVNALGLLDWEDDGRGDEEDTSYRTFYDYDTLGRRTKISPPLVVPTVITYEYSGSASLSESVEPTPFRIRATRGGFETLYTFDGFDRLTSKENLRTQDRTDIRHNAVGTRFREIDYLGGVLADTREYDFEGRLEQIIHSNGSTVTNLFNRSTVKTTDENGKLTVFSYKAFGDPDDRRLFSMTDSLGNTWTYDYDLISGLLVDIDAPGTRGDRSFGYNHRRLKEWETHPETGKISYKYTPSGFLKKRTRGVEGAEDYDWIEYARDPAGRLRWATPSDGSNTLFYHDDAGLRQSMTNSDSHVAYEYDYAQRLTKKTTNIYGRIYETFYRYNAYGQLARVEYPSGRSVNYAYDSKNRLYSVKDGNGGPDYVLYTEYHPWGGPKRITYQGFASTTYEYDDRLFLNSIVTTKGRTSHIDLGFDYDDVGNLKTWTDRRDTTGSRSFTYDDLYRLETAVAPGFWGSKTFHYDALGNRTSVILNGSTSVYDYNSSGHLTSVSGPSGGSYSYDSFGRLTNSPFSGAPEPLSVSDPNPPHQIVAFGESSTFTVTPSGGTAPYGFQWQFSATSSSSGFSDCVDCAGATTAQVTINNAQPNHGGWYRCVVNDSAGDGVVSSAARLIVVPSDALVYDGFTTIGTDRDVGESLHETETEVGNLLWSANSTKLIFGVDHLTHSVNGDHRATFPFDPGGTSGSTVATIEADINPYSSKWSQWVGIGFSNSLAGPFWNHGQVWMYLRANGNLKVCANGLGIPMLEMPEAPGFQPNGYNHLKLQYDWLRNQVTAWVNGEEILTAYDLDTPPDPYEPFTPVITRAGIHLLSNDLQAQTSQKVDNLELNVGTGLRMKKLVGKSKSHQRVVDRSSGVPRIEGNSSVMFHGNPNTETKSLALQNVSYDWTVFDTLAGVTTPNGTETYTYDGDNLRVSKASGGNTVHYIRDGAGQILAEYDGDSGSLLAEYVYASGKRIAKISNSGLRFYYHTDVVGTPLVITDQNGNLAWRGENFPFGTEYSNANQGDHFKFTGKELEDHSGLYYFEARYYDPVLGRFISVDPVDGSRPEPQTWNRYSYGLNNPLRFTDPTGGSPWEIFPGYNRLAYFVWSISMYLPTKEERERGIQYGYTNYYASSSVVPEQPGIWERIQQQRIDNPAPKDLGKELGEQMQEILPVINAAESGISKGVSYGVGGESAKKVISLGISALQNSIEFRNGYRDGYSDASNDVYRSELPGRSIAYKMGYEGGLTQFGVEKAGQIFRYRIPRTQ